MTVSFYVSPVSPVNGVLSRLLGVALPAVTLVTSPSLQVTPEEAVAERITGIAE